MNISLQLQNVVHIEHFPTERLLVSYRHPTCPDPRHPSRRYSPGSRGTPTQPRSRAAAGSAGSARAPRGAADSSPAARRRAAPRRTIPSPARGAGSPVGPRPTAYLESTENTALLKFSRLPPQRTTRTFSSTIFTQTQEPPSAGPITNFLHRPTRLALFFRPLSAWASLARKLYGRRHAHAAIFSLGTVKLKHS